MTFHAVMSSVFGGIVARASILEERPPVITFFFFWKIFMYSGGFQSLILNWEVMGSLWTKFSEIDV